MAPQPRHDFIPLFEEFVGSFLGTKRGERRVALYRESVEAGQRNYREVMTAAAQGEEITEPVLRKLLPYANNERNRASGAWVHPAPAVTRDVGSWLAWGGRSGRNTWPETAEAILHFIRRCVEDPGELAAACVDFSELHHTRGFQTGALTPILNANRPADYALVNNHARWALHHFTGVRHSLKLANYPATNDAIKRFIAARAEEIRGATGRDDIEPAHLYDMFAHWLAEEKRLFRNEEGTLRRKERKQALGSIGIDFQAESWEERIARLRKDLAPPERVQARRDWEARARARLERKLGRFDATDLRAFFHEVNGDRRNDRESFDRFAPAFAEPQIELMIRSIEPLNRWTEQLWRASESDVESLLEQFWSAHDVGGAGIVYPSLLLYLKDPQRYNVWQPIAEEGLKMIERFVPGKRRTASGYHTYNQALLAFRDRNGLAPQAVDLILWEIVRSTTAAPAPATPQSGPEPTPQPAPAIERVTEAPRDYTAPPREERISIPAAPLPIYTIDEMSRDTGIEPALLEQWARAVERKGQAIIYGPPGTGKTFVADRLARHLAGGGDGVVDLVQFHPAYSYEDFVLGIRPESREGRLEYPLVAGRFIEFCETARRREGRSVLVIDEINRANLARVLGELMYLLEYRDREIPLAGGRRFSIPETVRIIGTMNTADRSIALVDHALRRRFAFIELRPNYEVLRRFHADGPDAATAERLIAVLRRLNAEIGNAQYEVGISFFLVRELSVVLPDIWRMEIEPYLQEYFFDQSGTTEKYRWERIAEEIVG